MVPTKAPCPTEGYADRLRRLVNKWNPRGMVVSDAKALAAVKLLADRRGCAVASPAEVAEARWVYDGLTQRQDAAPARLEDTSPDTSRAGRRVNRCAKPTKQGLDHFHLYLYECIGTGVTRGATCPRSTAPAPATLNPARPQLSQRDRRRRQ